MSKTIGACQTCGKKISFYPCQKRKFCSQACAKKSLVGKPTPWLSDWRKSVRPKEVGEKISASLKGKKKTRSHMRNLRESIRLGFKKGSRKIWNKGKPNPDMQGKKHRWWKGGRFKTAAGYVMIHSPGHPYARKKGTRTIGSAGYVFEHRLVMEKFLGRLLLPGEKVHHRNGIKDDNRLKNLQLIANKPHYGEVDCPACHYKFLIH